ncbi:baseplate J/gp47 family protein [Clostridium felsineum]|uniref:baseplate J/gp47 family protein n=1 Tax=Clostridium felsineum TaxID=36839 RepID=UPI00098C6225|nr:baseplate J/gp47 family protein [Clostridium felsineum]URZ18537.1 hypothetical protein CLFE_046250 [Clostridium felsineum DSM 794]
MILLFDKSFEDLTKEADENLRNLGFSNSPGTVAKLLIDVVNKNIADFYDCLRLNHVNNFLSTASDEFLDSIGLLLNCTRQEKEADDDYRDRISKQILNTASANETAIRLTLLSIDGIDDVILKNCCYGMGSFSVVIITDASREDKNVLEEARFKLQETAAYGIKFDVSTPILKEISLKIKLIMKDTEGSYVKNIKEAVKENLNTYLRTRRVGENLRIKEIINKIMTSSEDILECKCEEFKINDNKEQLKDKKCQWNELFVVASNSDAISII